MASVDWLKIKDGGLRHLAVHFQQELRETTNHSNQHINKEMTKHNFSLGCEDFYDACDKLDARIKEVDEKYPPKRKVKDRVVACSLNIVCPEEISARGIDATKDYFKKVYGELETLYGKENVVGGFVHMDEIHEYTDAVTKEKRNSLHHMNAIVACYVDEEVTRKASKKNPNTKEQMKGINGKHFCSRKRMTKTNETMESICKEYGVEWHTGKGKNFETVETLKAKSAQADRELKEIELQEINSKIEKGVATLNVIEVEKQDILTEFRYFVKACQLPKTVESTVFRLLDAFNEMRKNNRERIKSWSPKKEKNDTIIKEKRKGIDDIDR